jgi:NADPH:quinone reductase-like Zn-dependent oxidoreductase
MSIQQQQAVIIPSPKASFVLSPRDIQTPETDEVLIKIMSVGLNPYDWARRVMDFGIPEYPAVLGCDVAGVVEQVGESVKGFKKGDRV